MAFSQDGQKWCRSQSYRKMVLRTSPVIKLRGRGNPVVVHGIMEFFRTPTVSQGIYFEERWQRDISIFQKISFHGGQHLDM
jgi:hypothetical protein